MSPSSHSVSVYLPSRSRRNTKLPPPSGPRVSLGCHQGQGGAVFLPRSPGTGCVLVLSGPCFLAPSPTSKASSSSCPSTQAG